MAVSLYVNTLRIVLKVDPKDGNSWSRIYVSLCCLRESLMCYICRKLAIIPVRSPSAKCQHNVCKSCVKKTLLMESHCKSCGDLTKTEENVQLRLLLQSYKKMCKLIMASGIFRCWKSSKLSSPMLRFITMVYEGAELADKYHYTSKFHNGHLTRKTSTSNAMSKCELAANQAVNGQRTAYGLKLSDMKSPKVMIQKASLKDCMISGNYTDSDASSDTSGFDGSTIIQECLRSVKKRKGCRCGMAKRNPGKLTCCGQRCPCYVDCQACINCQCRGCRNPQQNLISSPPLHSYRPKNVPSPEPINLDADCASSDEMSCSDSDKDPSV